jgi:hypothetical protein
MRIMSWVFIAVSATAAYRLRATSLFWPATVIAILNAWSLWSMNKTVESHGPNYTDTLDRVVTTMSILTTSIGICLLVWSFIR